MLKLVILLVAIAVFCTGIFFLWKILFSQNTATATDTRVTIKNHHYLVETAATLEQQAKGLAQRDSLAAGHGMIFPFSKKRMLAFTMHGMRFPLDIIWIADGKIVDMSKNILPDTGLTASAYRPSVPVDLVLEVNAGTADTDGLQIGDSVVITYP